MKTLTPKFLRKYLVVFKEKGLRKGIQAIGWPAAIALFLFFFLKGMLYLIIPYIIGKSVL